MQVFIKNDPSTDRVQNIAGIIGKPGGEEGVEPVGINILEVSITVDGGMDALHKD